MQGANKAFIKNPHHFLEHNVVFSPVVQSTLIQKWKADHGISDAQAQARLAEPRVYKFDLIPNHVEIFTSAAGKKYKSYQLALLEMRPLMNGIVKPGKLSGLLHSKSLSEAKTALTAKSPSANLARDNKETDSTNAIYAYYVPWDNGKSWTIKLGNAADFCFTPTLDGCSIAVEDGPTPQITHANFQHIVNNQTVVNQDAINNAVSQVQGMNTRGMLTKDDYTSHAEKLAGKQTHVTVVGIRDRESGNWSFYNQRRSKEMATDKHNQSIVKNIFSNRMVRI